MRTFLDGVCWNVWDLTVIAAASWLKYICYIFHSIINFAKKKKIIWPVYETEKEQSNQKKKQQGRDQLRIKLPHLIHKKRYVEYITSIMFP